MNEKLPFRQVSHREHQQSANFAKCRTANTYGNSASFTGPGQSLRDHQIYKSAQRLGEYDFSVLKKNNNYSNCNKLTRADAYYLKPKLATTNNSVKYDIVTNNVNKFRYS